MTEEEKREQTIQGLADLLRTTPFQVEFKVKKKPQGIKVIVEVTQEQIVEVTQEQMGEICERTTKNMGGQ